MQPDEYFMRHCIALARKGKRKVEPNPMVGCVIVHNGEKIGEGWHEAYGGPHAEVNAIRSVQKKELLSQATLYVSLEPCSHFGKTPPCSDLILEHKIPRVIVGCADPNPLVSGKGIEKLRQAGVEVTLGLLEKDCRELNRSFMIFHEKLRPEIILKWAESADGFIDRERTSDNSGPAKISSPEQDVWVHRLRSETSAIMVGTETALLDNPRLTVRLVNGKNPIRIVTDRDLRLPASLHLFDGTTATLVFTSHDAAGRNGVEYVKIDFNGDIVRQVLQALHQRNIQRLMVEGGAKLLRSFIDAGLWDIAYVIQGDMNFNAGVRAPEISKRYLVRSSGGITLFENK